jgi:hypothetical protein
MPLVLDLRLGRWRCLNERCSHNRAHQRSVEIFFEVVKAGGATVKVGKKSIQVDNIDKAAAVVQKLAELPDSGTSMKEKKAGTKKQATESVKLKKRK